ncbi:MAG: helix-turn-helix transcriptional regulator [Bacteroidales bacterium]|nr:helix-turn-helix transcriptional regulator [Bacteroidales bacterium]
MLKRITTIIETKHLTQSQFANAIGIQRSTLSHILSGRNNPSLEIILKILNTYPEISSAWLLNGSGEMIDNSSDITIDNDERVLNNNLVSSAINETGRSSEDSDAAHNSTSHASTSGYHKTPAQGSLPPEVDYASHLKKFNSKEIKSILVLFTDGTYDTFVK